MNMLQDYRRASKDIEKLSEEISGLREEENKRVREIQYDIYRPKIQVLEKEMGDKITEVELEIRGKVEEKGAEIIKQKSVVEKVKRIFALVEVLKDEEKEPKDLAVKVYRYSDRDENGNYISKRREVYFTPVMELFKDKYLQIKAYIVPTKKPVNKFALIIRGKSLFERRRELFDGIFGYVDGINDNASISITVREGKTEQELLDWFGKNESKVLEMCPANLEEIGVEYEEAKELIKQKQWQVAYWEYRKDYYENNYCRGTETDEYKAIIKELEKLKS